MRYETSIPMTKTRSLHGRKFGLTDFLHPKKSEAIECAGIKPKGRSNNHTLVSLLAGVSEPEETACLMCQK